MANLFSMRIARHKTLEEKTKKQIQMAPQIYETSTLQEFLHFTSGRTRGKMLKALATGRLSGVLPGAESPANLLIANDPARGLAFGKCTPGIGPGSTPDNLCMLDCRLL